MKVAVYSIALNEEKFVQRWYESAKEADYLFIADTGSSDKTVEIARGLGIVCHIISVKPWRFDDARNASLALLPEDIDYCIALDLDETIQPGWRKELEKAHANKVTRPRYMFTTTFNPDGSPGLQFSGIRIHARHGYRWQYPIHEVPNPYGIQETQQWVDINIEHHPDQNKSRGQYLPLLAQSAAENPEDSRCSFYYGRELYFHGLYAEATVEFKRYLKLKSATWIPERAAAMRYLAETEESLAEAWLVKAVWTDPSRRESHVKLGEFYQKNGQFSKAKESVLSALKITEKPLDYFCEPWAWNANPHDVLALAAYYEKDYKLALEHGKIALSLDPDNERYRVNMGYYQSKFEEL